jgi:hypothetical protein
MKLASETLYGVDGVIRTFTGEYINISDPKPEEIHIEDIAHALSLHCRFGGHTRDHYSVAEHSIWVMNMVSEEFKLSALLHDASEAYLMDIPSPIKKLIPDYIKIEDNLMTAIAESLGFQYPLPSAVKEADKFALEWEWKYRVLENPSPTRRVGFVKWDFINHYNKLKNK